jgi:hypothetical protein
MGARPPESSRDVFGAGLPRLAGLLRPVACRDSPACCVGSRLRRRLDAGAATRPAVLHPRQRRARIAAVANAPNAMSRANPPPSAAMKERPPEPAFPAR